MLMLAESSRTRDEVVTYLRQGSTDGALIVSTHAEDPLPGLLTEAGLPGGSRRGSGNRRAGAWRRRR
nr:hypothetical protein [Streptomyces sp. ISL-112]